MQFFQAHHIPLGTPLASTQHYAGVPLPGCTEGEGCFDRVEGTISPGNGVDTAINNGSTFIMATELTPQGPVTRTILTYSESANPDSPHYRDQTVLFAREEWVTERFTQAQINADPTCKPPSCTADTDRADTVARPIAGYYSPTWLTIKDPR